MKTHKFKKSVVYKAIEKCVTPVINRVDSFSTGKSIRQFLWPNINEKILLSTHSKSPYHGINPMPDLWNGNATNIKFSLVTPTTKPPKGKYYAILGSEKRTDTSMHILIDDNGKLRIRYDDQLQNDEKVTFLISLSNGVNLYDRLYTESDFPLDGSIRQIDLRFRSQYKGTFEYLLNDDVYNTIPLPTPVFDFRINQNYVRLLNLPIDDGWGSFPNIDDISGSNRNAISVKTQARNWAGIDHDNTKRWQNWITIGKDGDYYGFDFGWTNQDEELGRLKNATSAEGYYITALYQKGTSGKDVYIESVDAWDAKVNIFTLNIEPDDLRLIFHRDINNRGGYVLQDFGRKTNLHDYVGKTLGIEFHAKTYAIAESDKTVYLWQSDTTLLRMPNDGGSPYQDPTMRGFNHDRDSTLKFKAYLPTIKPKEKELYVILGVNSQGASSMPLNILNYGGEAIIRKRNSIINSDAKERHIVKINGVVVNTGDPIKCDGSLVEFEITMKEGKSGYFQFLGWDNGGKYEKDYTYKRYPSPIFDLHFYDNQGLIYFISGKGGATNSPLLPNNVENKRHIYISNVKQTDFAPILPNGSKDESNAGKA